MNHEWPKGPTEPLIQERSKSDLGKSFQPSWSERPALTEPEREELENRLTILGTVMNGSHLWWQLDGSLTLSLRRRTQGFDYVGGHSDIDISILRKEVSELESHLKEQGYALFLQTKQEEKRIFRRVGSEHFTRKMSRDVTETPYIAAIDNAGNIRTDSDLVRMQVSIIEMDNEGNPSERGLSYPKEWLEGTTVFINGVPLELSHPARHLLFKIWYVRNYDDKDVQMWSETQALSVKDLNILEHIVRSAASDQEWLEQNESLKPGIAVLEKRLLTLRAAVNKI